ncbi:hypothetical protein T02_16215 [Trichinella nativa]|uniref:Uncharacterized protein n=1 Tax=Trichinella nativa TaxID=6335 RepID=A0A0V1KLD2_9BILA|nr:hypothetical protein T02_16215 [Trichinella nativa]
MQQIFSTKIMQWHSSKNSVHDGIKSCLAEKFNKIDTIKLKIDRMRRKENPLGWAVPQQSIKGWCEYRSLQLSIKQAYKDISYEISTNNM